MVANEVRVIVNVYVYGTIVGKDHDPHNLSKYGCRLPGRMTCRPANPTL